MMNDTNPDPIVWMLRTLRLIVSALAVGVLMFGLVTLVISGGGLRPWDPGATVSMLLAIVSLGMLPAFVFVPGFVVQAASRQIAHDRARSSAVQPRDDASRDSDTTRLLSVFQTKTIISGAVLEGAALMNLVAFLLEGQVYSLGLAFLFLAGIVAGIPTRSALESWLERQLRHLKDIREH